MGKKESKRFKLLRSRPKRIYSSRKKHFWTLKIKLSSRSMQPKPKRKFLRGKILSKIKNWERKLFNSKGFVMIMSKRLRSKTKS